MEVPIHLQYIILHTGIMYCRNLCHSKVVWKFYTGLIVGILAFGGWCPHRWNPTRPLQIWWTSASWKGCLARPKVPWIGRPTMDCAMFEDNVLFCQVMLQMCSRSVPLHPDVLVLCQHCYILCTVILLCGRCDYF